MADDNKPKIDLKARLGKKTVTTAGGPAVPPPVGIPKPAVPGLSSAPRRGVPKVDASDPYSAISAADIPVKAEPQAIKIEMSAEVVAAQKKGRIYTVVLMLVAAVFAGGIGYAFGDRMQSNSVAQAAVVGASELVKEVGDANAKVVELDEVLKAAMTKLGENKYPEEEVKKLGEINVPFDGTNLVGKGIGRFPAEPVTMLIQFASGAQEANDAKEKLQLFMGAKKKAIESVLEQQNEATRKVRWSLFIINGPHGPWASMQPLEEKQWFLVTKPPEKKEGDKEPKPYSWPGKITIKDGGKDVELKRYESGSCTGSDPMIIPVDPTSHNLVCQTDDLKAMAVEVGRLHKVLAGDKSDPTAEKAGLVELGDLVVESLKKIGQP